MTVKIFIVSDTKEQVEVVQGGEAKDAYQEFIGSKEYKNIGVPKDIKEAPVQCQFCGGPTYDNRETKKSSRHPDFKCKNKDCNGAAWLKNGDLSWRR